MGPGTWANIRSQVKPRLSGPPVPSQQDPPTTGAAETIGACSAQYLEGSKYSINTRSVHGVGRGRLGAMSFF